MSSFGYSENNKIDFRMSSSTHQLSTLIWKSMGDILTCDLRLMTHQFLIMTSNFGVMTCDFLV